MTQLASHSRTYNIFALVDALGEPGRKSGCPPWPTSWTWGSPRPILVMLARQLRLLIRVQEATGDAPEVARSLNLPQGVVKRLGQQAGRFSAGALRSLST